MRDILATTMYYTSAQILNMIKALSNETRLDIMRWLSNPEESFSTIRKNPKEGLPEWGGACVGAIQEKSGLSQSTISSFLKSMQQADLLECQRHEKFTYYRINKAAVKALCNYIDDWRG